MLRAVGSCYHFDQAGVVCFATGQLVAKSLSVAICAEICVKVFILSL